MAAKPRRRAPQRRKPTPVRRRRSGLKILTAIGLLFVVFCAAAGATLWFAAAPQPPELTTGADAPAADEGFSADERKALDDLLRDRGGAKSP